MWILSMRIDMSSAPMVDTVCSKFRVGRLNDQFRGRACQGKIFLGVWFSCKSISTCFYEAPPGYLRFEMTRCAMCVKWFPTDCMTAMCHINCIFSLVLWVKTTMSDQCFVTTSMAAYAEQVSGITSD